MNKIYQTIYGEFKKSRKIVLLIFIATCTIQFVSAQETGNQNKIHPAFRRIIAHENITGNINPANDTTKVTLFPSHQKLAPINGFAHKGAPMEKRYNCIVYTKNPKSLLDSGIIINSILPNFVTAWVTTKEIIKMSRMQEVQYIDAPKTRKLHNDVARGNSGASLLGAGALNNTKYTGKGVVIGIYDTGLDWKHLDFRDPNDTTKSRVIKIWDQTLTAGTGEAPPTGFTYGVEYTQVQIDNELNGTPANFVREKDAFGHGTHVTGTAAGNGSSLATKKYMGMAPEADIVVIKGGNGTFTSDNIVDGITYLKSVATALGEPAVLNMSLGGEFSAHDGTDPEEEAIDDFTSSAPGRVASISAGNDNGTNIHKQLSLAGSGTNSLSVVVPSTTTATDLFEILTYADSNSAASVTVTAPSGATVTAAADQSVSMNVLGNRFIVEIDNEVDPANNNRYFDIYIQRNGNNTRNPQGTWQISFSNGTTANLTLNSWLAYINTAIPTTALTGGDNNYLVGTPGNATSAITVGAYAGKIDWYSTSTTAPGSYGYSTEEQDSMATFSSEGPRRDNVLKPDISAQGEAMVSCLSPDAGIDSSSADIVVQGLYFVDQGTSMSSPVVAGCAALLLQVDPTATAAQIKSSITSTANTDTLTKISGTMPNTTWGYGRLDVFKAASTLFSNCTPAARKTYQYDDSYTTSQDGGINLSTQRIALRVSPDITGRLGGVFFQTSTAIQNLTVEVRANNAGVPGTLLGTLNIPVADISMFSFNYFDLSALDITVNSGTDYFIVIYNSSGSGTWSIRRDATQADGRSLTSTNNGSTWANAGVDYRIRPVVYSTAQLTGNIATTSSSDTRDINTSNQFYNSNCELITTVVPDGTAALAGTTTAKVTIDATPFNYQTFYFAQRHYDIEPATNASTATANVTLYFTQAEFNTYNSTAGHGLDLPTSPTDAIGISNIEVAQYHGTGTPGDIPSYTGSLVTIDPADSNIVWNAANQRWEIGFDVTGFSGFYLESRPEVILPVTLGNFTAEKQGNEALLQWKTLQEINTSQFIIERSTDGITFKPIGYVAAAGNAITEKNYQFTDAAPLQGTNYYRFKLIDKDGKYIYSATRTLTFDNVNNLISISPNPVKDVLTVTVTVNEKALQLRLLNSEGQLIKLYNMAGQSIQLQLPNLADGIYYLQINGDTISNTNKFIIDNNQ